MATSWTRGVLVLSLGGLLIAGCAAGLSAKNETPGQRFDRAMKGLAENCAKVKLPPNDNSCDPLKLKPADPLATEEGRFAHGIKIPNPVPEDGGYKSGMTPEQYFDHLCKTEAGEFIYKTMENVEGLYLLRPREQANDYILQDLYALEDPYSFSDMESEAPQKVFINPPWRNYKFFEIPSSKVAAGTKYLRYFGYVQRTRPMQSEEVTSLKSRYGYTWRGIKRPHDRELGIAGGELIVMDLQSNEVLAVQRGFIRSGDVRNNLTGVWWIGGHVCPTYRDAHIYTYQFISKVLKPALSVGDGEGSNATK